MGKNNKIKSKVYKTFKRISKRIGFGKNHNVDLFSKKNKKNES